LVGAERPKFEGEGGGAEMRSCNSRVQFLGVTAPAPEVFFASSPSMSRRALNKMHYNIFVYRLTIKVKKLEKSK